MARGTGTKRGPRQPFQPRQPQPQQQNPQYQQPIMIPHPQQQQQQQNMLQQQQYHQVVGPPGVGVRGQQIMIQQVQMPGVRMQPQQAQIQQPSPQAQQPQQQPQQYYRMAGQPMPTSPSQMIVQQGQVPIRMQQQPQYQQISIQQSLPTSPSQPMMSQQVQMPPRMQQHTGIRKQMVSVNSWNQSPSPQQQQQQQQQQQLLQQQQQQQQKQQQRQQMPIPQQPRMVQIGDTKKVGLEQHVPLTEQMLKEPLISTLERNMNKQFFSHTLHRTFGPATAQIIQ